MKAGWIAMVAAVLFSLLAWWLAVGGGQLGMVAACLVVGQLMGLLVRWGFALADYRRIQRAFGLQAPRRGRRGGSSS
jgi:hypothetical protein